MKSFKMLVVAALLVTPILVAAPASASTVETQGQQIAEPAGWSADFSAWMCARYGVACG